MSPQETPAPAWCTTPATRWAWDNNPAWRAVAEDASTEQWRQVLRSEAHRLYTGQGQPEVYPPPQPTYLGNLAVSQSWRDWRSDPPFLRPQKLAQRER